MKQTIQRTIQAVAIDRFGGLETLTLRTLSLPEVGPGQVLVRVEWAGVGAWDVLERDGMFAEMYGGEPRFPYVLGSEGAGAVVAVGVFPDCHVLLDYGAIKLELERLWNIEGHRLGGEYVDTQRPNLSENR